MRPEKSLMELPFCKICGEHHRLGHCPEWDSPPIPLLKPPAQGRDLAPDQLPAGPVSVNRSDHEKSQPDPAVEEEGPRAVAQDQGREGAQLAQGRAFQPEDMKQETMPVTRQRFDRNAYQRELMRKRRKQGENA
jgi:hypothetical protein